MNEIFSTTTDLISFTVVLTPSLSFVMFLYWPAFAGYVTYCKIKFGTHNGEPLVTMEVVARMISMVLFATALFYLLQKRELKRFLQQ